MTAKIKAATYNLSTSSGKFALDRTFDFSNGVKVSFTVPVTDAANMTLADIHRSTIEQVIELLQSTLSPSTDQPSSKD